MTKTLLQDVQGEIDTRNFCINRVGIKDLILPLKIKNKKGEIVNVTSRIAGYNFLPAEKRGTHMSRFIKIFNEFTDKILDKDSFDTLLSELENALGEKIFIEIQFTYFKEKISPISKLKSYLNYDCFLNGEIENGKIKTIFSLEASIMSLCPASKAISEKNAHNQRGLVRISVETEGEFEFDNLIMLIEKQSSCEIFGLLKLEDEKYVTERAYNNAKFVEDTVRDIANILVKNVNYKSWKVTCENQESIHTHNAYAEIIYGGEK